MPDPVDLVICALTGSTTDTVGAFSYDINADGWWWSPAVYRIHGVEPGHVVPNALITVHREVEPADPNPTITTAIRSGRPFCSRRRIRDIHRRVRTVITVGHGVADGDGSITEIRG